MRGPILSRRRRGAPPCWGSTINSHRTSGHMGKFSVNLQKISGDQANEPSFFTCQDPNSPSETQNSDLEGRTAPPSTVSTTNSPPHRTASGKRLWKPGLSLIEDRTAYKEPHWRCLGAEGLVTRRPLVRICHTWIVLPPVRKAPACRIHRQQAPDRPLGTSKVN